MGDDKNIGKAAEHPLDPGAIRKAIIASRDPNRTGVTICGGTGWRVHSSEEAIDALPAG